MEFGSNRNKHTDSDKPTRENFSTGAANHFVCATRAAAPSRLHFGVLYGNTRRQHIFNRYRTRASNITDILYHYRILTAFTNSGMRNRRGSRHRQTQRRSRRGCGRRRHRNSQEDKHTDKHTEHRQLNKNQTEDTILERNSHTLTGDPPAHQPLKTVTPELSLLTPPLAASSLAFLAIFLLLTPTHLPCSSLLPLEHSTTFRSRFAFTLGSPAAGTPTSASGDCVKLPPPTGTTPGATLPPGTPHSTEHTPPRTTGKPPSTRAS